MNIVKIGGTSQGSEEELIAILKEIQSIGAILPKVAYEHEGDFKLYFQSYIPTEVKKLFNATLETDGTFKFEHKHLGGFEAIYNHLIPLDGHHSYGGWACNLTTVVFIEGKWHKLVVFDTKPKEVE